MNWNNLTKAERARYMQFQMFSPHLDRSGYLPEDCGECVCGTPMLGCGLCPTCSKEFNTLIGKLRG